MPFPLAHPAAVLPLRRYCPRWLSFPALLVGSLAPDLAYPLGLGDYSHSLAGSFGFCLPVGLTLVAAYYGLGPWLERCSSERWPQAPWSLLHQPRSHWLGIIMSVLLGAWSHLLLDGVSHKSGWFVQHLPFLQTVVATSGGRTLRLFHLISYVLTFAGAVFVCRAYQSPPFGNSAQVNTSSRIGWFGPLMVASMAVVMGLLHHMTLSRWHPAVVELLSVGFLVALIFFMRPRPERG